LGNKWRGDSRGAALVELALALPLLVMLLVGMVSAGIAYNNQLALTHAAREGGRYGATLPVTNFGSLAAWLDEVSDQAVADDEGVRAVLDPGASRDRRPLEVPDLTVDVGRDVLVRGAGKLGCELTGGVDQPSIPGLIELVARLFASLPGAQVGARSAIVVVALAIAAGMGARHVRARPVGSGPLAVAAVAAALVVLAGWWWTRPAPAWDRPAGLRVTFLDVGQGDAALLETPSARVLVDQGPPEANVAGQLLRMGVRSLSALVLTHPERDHVGGAAAVLRRLRVGAVLDPGLEAIRAEARFAALLPK